MKYAWKIYGLTLTYEDTTIFETEKENIRRCMLNMANIVYCGGKIRKENVDRSLECVLDERLVIENMP